MSDRLPSDDQLRRIEQGVMGRIDARRRLRNRIIGATTAVVLVGGGFGLVASALGGGLATTSSSASRAESTADTVPVRCALGAGSDTEHARSVRVRKAALPDAAVAACGGTTTDFQSAEGTVPKSASGSAGESVSTASPSLGPNGVLCTDVDGSLVVLAFSGSVSATCVRAGMEPYTR